MYIQMRHQPGLSGPGWSINSVIEATKILRGHEILIDLAARSLIKNPADLAALINDSRVPDLVDPRTDIKLGEEHHHFLRSITKSSLSAWNLSIDHLRTLHQQMVARSNRADQLMLIGEALHLIQDSVSPAHVELAPLNTNPEKEKLL